MSNTIYEKYSRAKSSLMLSLCILSTIVILTVLGLVTGFLTANGYKGITARPAQLQGALVGVKERILTIDPLSGGPRLSFRVPEGTTIIDGEFKSLKPGMTLVVRYSTADSRTATYVRAFVEGTLAAAPSRQLVIRQHNGQSATFNMAPTVIVTSGGKTQTPADLKENAEVRLMLVASDPTTAARIESPPEPIAKPKSGLLPPIFGEDPQLSELEPDYPGGLKNGIIGTLVLIGLASLVGIPVGMLTGIYLAEYSDGSVLAGPVRFISDVLTGVPSIVVGILGYELLVKPFKNMNLGWGPTGFNGWAGSLALAFIMIPLVARTTEEMLLLVPKSYREASVALGATKARTILKVVLPAATGSVITGIMLAIARVAGETAPLLFTVYGLDSLELNPNHQFPALTLQIYKNSMTPDSLRNNLAWAGILVLLLLIFVLNIVVRATARAVGQKKQMAG